MSKNFRPQFIPTLDIAGGKAVLVRHGKVDKILGDAFEKAQQINICANYQLVDIDGAKREGKNNRELIKAICKKWPCYVGGGIDTVDDANELLNASARRVIVSTHIEDLIEHIPKERLIVAFDVDADNRVFSKGRNGVQPLTLFEYMDKYAGRVEMITITFHQVEGTCAGIPMDQVKGIMEYIEKNGLNIKLVVAGGITTGKEIRELFELGAIPQFGSGFWRGKFTLGEAFQTLCEYNLEKDNVQLECSSSSKRVIQTVVQSEVGIVLGCVSSTPESVRIAVDTRVATFYSKERDSLWFKGATSGDVHHVQQVHYCCDGKTLRMVVSGDKPFCHLGHQSCYGDNDPSRASLKALCHIFSKHAQGNGYTNEIMQSNALLAKIMEESTELVCATRGDDIVHETADLVYFVLLNLIRNGIEVHDVERELLMRQYAVLKTGLKVRSRYANKLKIGIMINTKENNLCPADRFVIDYLQDLFGIKICKERNNPRCLKYVCKYTGNAIKNKLGYAEHSKECSNQSYFAFAKSSCAETIQSMEEVWLPQPIINKTVLQIQNETEPPIMIVPMKPKDIAMALNGGIIDGVVSFEDVMKNYPNSATKIPIMTRKKKRVSIVVAAMHGTTIESLKGMNSQGEKPIIMAEYVKLANDWATEIGLTAKINQVSGSAEGFVVAGLADACVVVCDTGTTLQENGMHIIAELTMTDMNLFVRPERMKFFYKILNNDFV